MTLRSLKTVIAAASVAGMMIAGYAQEATPAGKRAELDRGRLSAEFLDLAKLVQSGVDEQVVLKYLENTPPKRNPTADELVYLHELGLTSAGMVSLLNAVPKVSLVRPPIAVAGGPMEPIAQSAPANPAPAATASTTSGTAVVSSPAPTVVYTQPVPATVYIQEPPVVRYYEPAPRFTFGLSFGNYWGHHGWHHGHHIGWGGHWHGGHHRRHRW